MPAALQLPRSLPWRQPSTTRRQVEGVRPIFWSNRPKSYLSRTADWDKFPQGRSVLLRALLLSWVVVTVLWQGRLLLCRCGVLIMSSAVTVHVREACCDIRNSFGMAGQW